MPTPRTILAGRVDNRSGPKIMEKYLDTFY